MPNGKLPHVSTDPYEMEVSLKHLRAHMTSVQQVEYCDVALIKCGELPWLQVILRAREAEMQFLRQEAHSLKEELKIARMVVLFEMYWNNSVCGLSQEPSVLRKKNKDEKTLQLVDS